MTSFPLYHSCGEYTAEYLTSHTGYLVNPSSLTTCSFCRAATGDEYLSTLNIVYADRWQSLGVLAAYTVTNVIIAYVLVFYPPKWPAWMSLRKLTGQKGEDGTRRATAAEVAEESYERELAMEQTEILLDRAGPL